MKNAKSSSYRLMLALVAFACVGLQACATTSEPTSQAEAAKTAKAQRIADRIDARTR